MRARFALALVSGLVALAAVPSVAAVVSKRENGIRRMVHPRADQMSSGTFSQQLDHDDAGKGTFEQRYWWDSTHWNGPGSPVFLFNVGESAADGYTGYLNNETLPGYYAQEFKGAVIIIEHRYWGQSNPFKTLTAETLQYLDVEQSIHDMTYFAQHVDLAFDSSNSSDHGANAPNAPWVLVGGSYPGALAAWTSILDPGVFWAYHASSAVVQAIADFHPYFDAVTAGMPANCSNDLKAVITHVDSVLVNGSSTDVATLKKSFGLGSLSHHDDFAAAIATPLWAWQSSEHDVIAFCDHLETSTASGLASATGLGADAALSAYAAYIKESVAPQCADSACDSYANPDGFNKPDDESGMRQWSWMLCNDPFAWWQVGPPEADGQHVVSSQLRADSDQRLCPLMFPNTNGFEAGSGKGRTVQDVNRLTGGWDASFERVIFVNGERDPWLPATVVSKYREGGARLATDHMPIFNIQAGNHVPDLILNDDNMETVDQIMDVMRAWLGEWKAPTGR